MTTKLDRACTRSARVSLAGFGVRAKQSGSLLPRRVAGKSKEVRDRHDAVASTRDACPTLDFLRSLRIKNAVEVYA